MASDGTSTTGGNLVGISGSHLQRPGLKWQQSLASPIRWPADSCTPPRPHRLSHAGHAHMPGLREAPRASLSALRPHELRSSRACRGDGVSLHVHRLGHRSKFSRARAFGLAVDRLSGRRGRISVSLAVS
ncbi:hypothetical protein L1887_59126 [Cichorium endivia]|nr:hypothetical protein L1887_59126 [Cichorium endivia]